MSNDRIMSALASPRPAIPPPGGPLQSFAPVKPMLLHPYNTPSMLHPCSIHAPSMPHGDAIVSRPSPSPSPSPSPCRVSASQRSLIHSPACMCACMCACMSACMCAWMCAALWWMYARTLYLPACCVPACLRLLPGRPPAYPLARHHSFIQARGHSL
jgi:hypothetical protein